MDGVEPVSVRAKQLMDQIMKTWDPPLLTGNERPADIAQTATMVAIAYIMGREVLPAELSVNQREAINSGLVVFFKTFIQNGIDNADTREQ